MGFLDGLKDVLEDIEDAANAMKGKKKVCHHHAFKVVSKSNQKTTLTHCQLTGTPTGSTNPKPRWKKHEKEGGSTPPKKNEKKKKNKQTKKNRRQRKPARIATAMGATACISGQLRHLFMCACDDGAWQMAAVSAPTSPLRRDSSGTEKSDGRPDCHQQNAQDAIPDDPWFFFFFLVHRCTNSYVLVRTLCLASAPAKLLDAQLSWEEAHESANYSLSAIQVLENTIPAQTQRTDAN